MSVGYITHDEAVIKHFIEDHNFAELYLQTVREDGDAEEIAEVQAWYDEAEKRKNKVKTRWANVAAVL